MPDFDDFFEGIKEIHEQAKKSMESPRNQLFMRLLTPGTCFISPRPDMGLIIYGEVVESEYKEDQEHIANNRDLGWVFCKCYSQVCIEGELGDTHVSRIAMIIPRELFEFYKESQWESSL